MVKVLQITCENKGETLRMTSHLWKLTGKSTKIFKIKFRSLWRVALERSNPRVDVLSSAEEHIRNTLPLNAEISTPVKKNLWLKPAQGHKFQSNPLPHSNAVTRNVQIQHTNYLLRTRLPLCWSFHSNCKQFPHATVHLVTPVCLSLLQRVKRILSVSVIQVEDRPQWAQEGFRWNHGIY